MSDVVNYFAENRKRNNLSSSFFLLLLLDLHKCNVQLYCHQLKFSVNVQKAALGK